MLPVARITQIAFVVVTMLLGPGADVRAQGPAEQFYHAYYLEEGCGDVAAAAKIYADIVDARGLPAELQARAKVRLAACREDLAAEDFTRLMPPEPLVYVELNRPGERIGKLLDKLGLLARPDTPPTQHENRVAISPAILDALLGMRGVAAAVTGFDMMRQQPAGVAVLHPGDMELVRGLIETALPAGATPTTPIDGFATYEIENVLVTLTQRLVIVGTGAHEIEGVIERMRTGGADSLAGNETLAQVLAERRGALLFFCANPRPLMPLVQPLLANAGQNREVALARALLDIESLRALSGRFDLSDEGVLLQFTLQLEEGHRNLVYNFFRRPGVDPATLKAIPADAAALAAVAMNAAPPDYQRTTSPVPTDPAVVTALDLGRELFANINGIAVFVLPPAGTVKAKNPLPDVAAVITVNDPAKSQALWGQLLGLGSLAAGAPTMEGTVRQVAGTEVRSYHFDKHATVHVAILDHQLLITLTEGALDRTLATRQTGRSIVDDPGLAAPLARVGPHTTMVAAANTGRCLAVAKPFMCPADLAEAEPYFEVLHDTTVGLTIEHSPQTLQLTAAVTGMPDISGVISRLITQERKAQRAKDELAAARRHRDWGRARALLDEQLAVKPDDPKLLRGKFDVLAAQRADADEVLAVANRLLTVLADDPQGLNNFAWDLLTQERYGLRHSELALQFARRANELTKRKVWQYVDTLALAEYQTGNHAAAIELEEQAIELCEAAGGQGVDALRKALAQFREAVASR